MHINRDSLLSLAQVEPERTKLLLKVAGAGGLTLLVWTAAGKALTGDIIFVLVDLAAIVAYAAAMVILTGNLVRGADRWQVESAMQARRLLTTGRRGDAGPAPALPAAATFDQWYFILRLEDEIKRARRHGSVVSVVVMRIGPVGAEPTAAVVEQINFDVAQLAASHSTVMTMPSAIGPLEYAFLLTDSNREEARTRIAPLLAPLGDYLLDFGIAVYPDDGTQAEALVALAQEQIEEGEAAP